MAILDLGADTLGNLNKQTTQARAGASRRTVHRRTVLKGLAAGAVLGPASALTSGGTAEAAAGYHLAVVDQNSRTVRIFDRDAERWNDDAVIWSFAGKEPWLGKKWWSDLSDVKIRKTQARGRIALVCASGGAAGIVQVRRGEHTDSDNDLIWQAYPDDNPHSIERIPHNGSILTASSKGGKNLQLYSPKNPDSIDDFDSYEKVNSWRFPGAHGILWDPRTKNEVSKGVLWVLGDGKLVGYKVKGSGQNTDLDVWREVAIDHPGAKMGHDLQPDFTMRGHLLLTDSKGVYRYDVNSNDKVISNPIWAKGRVKSIARHPVTKEYIWVVGSPETGEMGTQVSIGKDLGTPTHERGWPEARFYKARIFSPDYE
ncbi:DUF6528 family protein [Arthrobacter pascens]|uniref:DUF6528 family protein n=1 Tax=Arthrobacter pascens TaxID=1677 RepID=UPI00196B646E|nr:DUF6528 family protein [Arthrobacter pascens]MBN3497767.1 hypothetical protein [Arthrobacter pascens]